MKKNLIAVVALACQIVVSSVGVAAAGATPCQPAEKENVVFVGAHQDDIISSLGTMILMKDQFKLHVVDYTDGGYGSNPKASEIRRKEEQSVCVALGAEMHEIGERDGDTYASRESVAKLHELLRRLKPRAVFTHWPIDLHSDHLMTAAATLKAIRMAGEPIEVYFFEYSYDSKGFPDVNYVDISAVAEEKRRLIRLYKSANGSDGMCAEEMLNSKRRALHLWPPKFRKGYAEAFCPLVGRAQGKCIFTELKPDPVQENFPSWGR